MSTPANGTAAGAAGATRPLLTEQQLAHLPAEHPLRAGGTAESPLIRAMTGRTPQHHPVWFMRQAGRSLPEYRQAREGTAMLEACLRRLGLRVGTIGTIGFRLDGQPFPARTSTVTTPEAPDLQRLFADLVCRS